MFSIPSAKRVRRDDLQSPNSSPLSSPDPGLEDLFRAQATNQFTFTTTTDSAEKPNNEDEAAAISDADEAELILFAAPTSTSNTVPQTHKIRLSSPTAENADPGLSVKKPRSYYLADEPDAHRLASLRAAAVDGKDVLEMSKLPWAGCALPWKVRTISLSKNELHVLVGDPPKLVTVDESERKRGRMGKKSRIALRKKMEAKKNKQSESARAALEKEEAEREKRTRRNREKKLKKKEKEKAEKAKKVDEGTVANESLGADGVTATSPS